MDDGLFVNNDGLDDSQRRCNSAFFDTGKIKTVRIEFFESGGDGEIVVYVAEIPSS